MNYQIDCVNDLENEKAYKYICGETHYIHSVVEKYLREFYFGASANIYTAKHLNRFNGDFAELHFLVVDKVGAPIKVILDRMSLGTWKVESISFVN